MPEKLRRHRFLIEIVELGKLNPAVTAPTLHWHLTQAAAKLGAKVGAGADAEQLAEEPKECSERENLAGGFESEDQ